MDLVALKKEIQDDTLGRGYAGMSHEQIAESLSNVRDRQPGRETLDAGLLVASIVRSEYAALGAGEKDYIRLIAAVGSLPLTKEVRQELSDIFPQGSETRKNLRALLKRQGSRAEELGLGSVTPSDVARALQN